MTKIASQYHDSTSYIRDSIKEHRLDWLNQPRLTKVYENLQTILLPHNRSFQQTPLMNILKTDAKDSDQSDMNTSTLSSILSLTYSVTARAKFSRGEYLYRSAASAGALYPVEIYIMIRGINGIEDGIYYFNPERFSLNQLRKGDFSSHAGNLAVPPLNNIPNISFIFSAIFFRSSWKYRERAYRYNLLDTGHVLENLFIALRASKMCFEICMDFDDKGLNNLVGINESREVSLAAVNITSKDTALDAEDSDLETLSSEITDAGIVSMSEIDYPEIREIHTASAEILNTGQDEETAGNTYLHAGSWRSIQTQTESHEVMQYPESLFKRRSKRNFINSAIENPNFMSILEILSESYCYNKEKENRLNLTKISFFADNVDGIVPGYYSFDMAGRRFGIISEGLFGEKTANMCLNQEWLKNAGLFFLITADLDHIEKTHGPRGYRYAMINAGRIGQRLYIAATSLGLGCCGIGAFYDSEASELLNLDENTRLLYLVAAGKIKTGDNK